MNDRFSESTEKIAVVDIGANSVRMNVYDINTETGRFSVCDSARSMLGLAAYTSGGRLSPDGEGRLFAVLREYLARANSLPADDFFAFATASLRGLSNTDKVLDSIKKRLGTEITVISGEEEAERIWTGHVPITWECSQPLSMHWQFWIRWKVWMSLPECRQELK